MAISKIKLGNAEPVALRDAASMHYVGHTNAGITENDGIYTSSTTLESITDPIVKNDYITYGTGNENYVCTNVTGTTATWALLSEAAVIPPVQTVKVNSTALTPDENHAVDIPAATASDAANAKFGVVETGANITNSNGVISVPDATALVKGVVQLSTAIPSTGAVDTKVATEKAVADAIATLPRAMIFKGTLGDTTPPATITALPTAAASTLGDVYKVIVKGTYGSQDAEVGDLFICAQTGTGTYTWELIPSGDVPDGTVTSVAAEPAAGSNLTVTTTPEGGTAGDPITAAGTITVGVAAEHTIPADADITKWNVAYNKVNPYSENNSVMTAISVNATQATGGVLALSINGADSEQLDVLYINPTNATNAVFKPV